jgi:PAS domain S-box-containing protein
MNILYVEDDRIDAEAVQRELCQNAPHCRVEIVATQQQALERLEEHVEDYDLVLTDFQLPDGDGLTLLRHIRTQALPLAVVVITGQGDEETAVTVLKAGANDYIVKRTDYLARLPLTLENAVHQYRADATRRAHPLRVLYAEHNTADIDLTRRHLERYAPYIALDAIHTAPEIIATVTSSDATAAYDVLLLDYRLPGMNALELLKELQQRFALDIPVVLVTGQGDVDVATQALKLGASDYIAKNSGYLYQLPSVLENAYHRAKLSLEQAALRESEQRLRNIVEHMPVLLDAFDEQDHFIFWNTECERVTGYTANEIVGNPQAMELLVPDSEYRAEILERRHALGNHYRDLEFTVTCKNGRTRTIAWSNISRNYPIPGWWSWGIGLDVTARKQAESELQAYFEQLEDKIRERTAELQETQAQLVRQEKLAVLGQLAGGVGHELRTPLATISNAVYYLNMILPDAGETTREYLGIIETEVRNSERIIAELLDFARIDTPSTQAVQLATVMHQALKKQAPSAGIHLRLEIPPKLPPVIVDPRHMEQILDNLLLNAYQAMPQGGELRVNAEVHDGSLRLSVADTGAGISEDNLSKLFEPLFTTKTRGIGLGLAICKKLVEANGGTILVESQEGCGSTFIVTLPTKESQI